MTNFTCPECDEKMEVSDRMVGRKVRCVGCGARIVVSDEAPRRVERSRRSRVRRRPVAELRQIALYQKAILLCILAYIVAVPTQFLIPAPLRPLLLIVVVPVLLTATVFVFLMAIKLYDVGLGVLLGILSMIPLVGLIILLIVNGKATSALQENGYRVGLLGARLSQFDEDDDED
jgi:DNA-directed RNA polymerase subunit RPC12/RpoP